MKKRLYDDRKWRRAAKYFLCGNPLCVMCQKSGIITPATVVDHIIPHSGDYDLFWDSDNWQALCVTCHNGKRVIENHGHSQAAGPDGLPIDPGHPWNRR